MKLGLVFMRPPNTKLKRKLNRKHSYFQICGQQHGLRRHLFKSSEWQYLNEKNNKMTQTFSSLIISGVRECGSQNIFWERFPKNWERFPKFGNGSQKVLTKKTENAVPKIFSVYFSIRKVCWPEISD